MFRWLILREITTFGQNYIHEIVTSDEKFINFFSGFEVRNYTIIAELALESISDARDRHAISVVYSTELNDYIIYGHHEGDDGNSVLKLSDDKDFDKLIDAFESYTSLKVLAWTEYYPTETSNEDAQPKLRTQPIDERITVKAAFRMPGNSMDKDPFKRLVSAARLNKAIEMMMPTLASRFNPSKHKNVLAYIAQQAHYQQRWKKFATRS